MRHWFAFATIAVALLLASNARAETLIAIAGDSLATCYPDDYSVPVRGWAQKLPKYFQSDVSWFCNASEGQSAQTFIDSGRWGEILAQKAPAPSYILIAFGYEDAYTTGVSAYAANLKTMISDACGIGAEPILVTPPAYRSFTEDGKVQRTTLLTPFVTAMKQVGTECGVHVIDLQASTLSAYDALGAAGSQTQFGFTYKGIVEIVGFSANGADQVAKMIVAQLPTDLSAAHLVPVPEPSALAAIASLLVCGAAIRWKRRQ
jgi:hypothetical protein